MLSVSLCESCHLDFLCNGNCNRFLLAITCIERRRVHFISKPVKHVKLQKSAVYRAFRFVSLLQ